MKRWMTGILATVAVLAGGGVAGAQLDDSVTVLHAIPGITVDLKVDGEVVVAGFDAGDTQDFTPLAGMTLQNIEAVRSGSDEVVIGPIDSFTVPADGNNSVVVHLDSEGAPTITAYPNAEVAVEQGQGLLTVRHAAAAAPVGIVVDGEEVLSGIGNGQGDGVVLPAGEIVGAQVTVDGDSIASMPNLRLEPNTQLIVYVGGSVADDNLAFYLQSVAGGEVASLPAPSERQVAPEQSDGTPQPDGVDTGNSLIPRGTFTPQSGVPIVGLVAGIAVLASVGAGAVVVGTRRRSIG